MEPQSNNPQQSAAAPEPLMDVFTPDDPTTKTPGTKGTIPLSQWASAQKQGFKVAVRVTDPNGNGGWLPNDQVAAAMKDHGFKLGPPSQQHYDPNFKPPAHSFSDYLAGRVDPNEGHESEPAPHDATADFLQAVYPRVTGAVKNTGKMAILSPGMAYKAVTGGRQAAENYKRSLFPDAPRTWNESADVVSKPLQELAGVRQPGESVLDPAYNNPEGRPGLLDRTINAMSAATGGDPQEARRLNTLALDAENRGDQDSASTYRAQAAAAMIGGPVGNVGPLRAFEVPAVPRVINDAMQSAGRLPTATKAAFTRTPAQQLANAIRPAQRGAFITAAEGVMPDIVQASQDLGLDTMDHAGLLDSIRTARQSILAGATEDPVQAAAANRKVDALNRLEKELSAVPDRVANAPAPRAATRFSRTPKKPAMADVDSAIGKVFASRPSPISLATQQVNDAVAAQPTGSEPPDFSIPAEIRAALDDAPKPPRVPLWKQAGTTETRPQVQMPEPMTPAPLHQRPAPAADLPEPLKAIVSPASEEATPSAPTQSTIPRTPSPEDIVTGWLMRSKRADVLGVAKQLGIGVSAADNHSTLIPQIVDRLHAEGAMETMAEFAHGLRGAVPPGQRPAPANPDLTGVLQQSLAARGIPREVIAAATESPDIPAVIRDAVGLPPGEQTAGIAHGTAGASVEELARGEQFWRVKRNGQLSYQGVAPDANLQPGEALIAIDRQGNMRVQGSRNGLSDNDTIQRFGPKIKHAANPRNISLAEPAEGVSGNDLPAILAATIAPRDAGQVRIMVRRRDDGQLGHIPTHQLGDALSSGAYELAQPMAA